MELFNKKELGKLYQPGKDSSGEDNGQVTIIGGSRLFHGAPLLSLKVASRIVDMVFFTSPEKSLRGVVEKIKSRLSAFIWVPWAEINDYLKKSDAVLIGPGLMRFRREKVPHGQRYRLCDETCQMTRAVTKTLLLRFPKKKWVVDAGSLQTMRPQWIPKEAVLTPNNQEFAWLFGVKPSAKVVLKMAEKYQCVIVAKGPKTLVCSSERCLRVRGGNPGMTKGGTGDVLAGLTVALLAKNEPFLAATAASFVAKAAADELYKKVGIYYNADDLAEEIPKVLAKLTTGWRQRHGKRGEKV